MKVTITYELGPTGMEDPRTKDSWYTGQEPKTLVFEGARFSFNTQFSEDVFGNKRFFKYALQKITRELMKANRVRWKKALGES